MDQEKSETTGNVRRWWLSTTGKAEGPYTESYIIAGLKTNTIAANAHACPVGAQEWKAVIQWPAFADAVVPVATGTPPVPPQGTATAYDSMLTNPRLPPMANWICVYTLLVSPLLWCIDNLSCCFTGTYLDPESDLFGFEILLLFFEAVATLAVTVVLFLGGLRLKSLKASGPTIIKIGLWTSLGLIPLFIMLYIPLFVTAGENDLVESTTAQDIISFFALCVGLVVYAFEIFSLIWLYRNAKSLPLTETK